MIIDERLAQHCYAAAVGVPIATAGVRALEDAALQALPRYGGAIDPAQRASLLDNPWHHLQLSVPWVEAIWQRVVGGWRRAGLAQVPGSRQLSLAALEGATVLDRPFGYRHQSLCDHCFWGLYAQCCGFLYAHDHEDTYPRSQSRLNDPPLPLLDTIASAYLSGYGGGADSTLFQPRTINPSAPRVSASL